MTSTRDLDFAPLARTVRFRARLKAATADNLMVMAGTVGVLLVIVPVAVFIGLVATGNATDVGGLVVLAMCFGCGVYALFDVLRKSGGAGALENFARANDLVLVRGTLVPHYAGSLFADESHAVRQSVRTKDEFFVEVGECFPTTAPRGSREPNRATVFLRARLTGPSTRDPRELVTPALHDALSRFAGDYTLEVWGDELTLFGSDGLEVGSPGRVQEAFVLIDDLAARADAALVPATPPGALATTPASPISGMRTPVGTLAEPQGSPWRARTVVGWILALLIGGSFAIAIIMSILDNHLRGNERGARFVVSLIVLVTFAAIARLGKAAVTVRRTRRSRKPDGQHGARHT